MQDEDRSRYETLFYCQKLEDGFLSGDGARALFIRSKLPLSDLTRIWKLSDVTHDNKLDVFEFSLAFYLIELKLCGYELPKQLDPSLYENSKNDVVIPRMTEKEKQRFQKLFKHKDSKCEGYLEKEVIQPLMVATNLSPSVLSRVWNIADLDRDGRLSFIEFCIAFHVLKNCLDGVSLDGPMNPFLCFPDEENIIRMCKDNLKIFDKQYLVVKKERRVESSYFITSIREINDSDFDMLVQCMSPAVLTKVVGSHSVVDENGNTYSNEEDIHSKTGLENGLATVHIMQVSSEENPDRRDLDNIEAQQITTNELSVNLENVFEMVEKEHGNYFENVPIYIPPPKIYEEEEPLEVNVAVLQRRPYSGKDLIYEDRIGSETIADVEFEVDFDSVVSDIVKESVEEERKLPIARVLPIYKTPPSNIEPFVEKKTIKKDNDFNIILDLKHNTSDDIGVKYETPKTINSVGKENTALPLRNNVKSNQERNPISSDVTAGKKRDAKRDDSTEVKSTKNLDKDDAVDIVEQKRMIVINQAEERKKNREKKNNNKTMKNREENDNKTMDYSDVPESRTIIKKSFKYEIEKKNSENTQRGKQVTSREDSLSEKSSWLIEKKEERLVAAQSFPKIENLDYVKTTSENNSEARQTTEPTEINMKYESNEQTNHDDVEDSIRHEAEEKERLLLERIKVLERKRKELLEKKQRELKVVEQKKNGSVWNDDIKRKKAERYESEDKMKVVSAPSESKKKTKEFKCADVWSNNTSQLRDVHHKIISEEEKRLLTLAAEEKRIKEAELEKRHQVELREAEKRRRENMAREEEELGAAEERKRHFLENLEKLKQRVFTEETENPRTRHGSGKTMAGVVSQAMGTYMGSKEDIKDKNRATKNTGNKLNKIKSPFSSNKYEGSELSKEMQSEDLNQNEELEYEAWQQNFKSNRELFMKKAESQGENSEVVRRNTPTKVRPKSYHSGMFNRPVHRIIDDDTSPDKYEHLENPPDFVDEEALKQYRREEEFKKEHEKVVNHRRNLERDTSYTVENVEKIWDIDADIQPPNIRTKSESSSSKQTRASDNPNRRSLVNTLTTGWNSFIDILEDDKKRESETVKMRQEISEQRKSSLSQTKHIQIIPPSSTSNDIKSSTPKTIPHSSSTTTDEVFVKSGPEVIAKQSGKVRQLVKSYKRLSAPCLQDVFWKLYSSPKKTDEDTQIENHDNPTKAKRRQKKVNIEANSQAHSMLKRQDTLKDSDINQLDAVKKTQLENIIKDNAPRRKPNLAHAWSNVVSRQ